MSNVRVPEIKVTIFIEGNEVARFGFNRTGASPDKWEITAALDYADCKSAMRACLLACVAELQTGEWEAYTFVPESGSSEDDQLQLAWS